MANKQILALNSTVNLDDVCFVSDLEARQLVKQNKAYWDILDNNIPRERVLVFSSPDAFYKKKGLVNKPMETHYMLDIQNKNADERVRDVIEKTNELNKMMNYDVHDTSDIDCYYQPEKVKAIKNTIEQYMKNTGKSDLKDIDLTELSSCINATFNRKKLFYKWFDEYVNGSDCSEEERYTACEFLDWVFVHKIDGDKTGDLYFKE